MIAAGMADGFSLDETLPWEARPASAMPRRKPRRESSGKNSGRSGWARIR